MLNLQLRVASVLSIGGLMALCMAPSLPSASECLGWLLHRADPLLVGARDEEPAGDMLLMRHRSHSRRGSSVGRDASQKARRSKRRSRSLRRHWRKRSGSAKPTSVPRRRCRSAEGARKSSRRRHHTSKKRLRGERERRNRWNTLILQGPGDRHESAAEHAVGLLAPNRPEGEQPPPTTALLGDPGEADNDPHASGPPHEGSVDAELPPGERFSRKDILRRTRKDRLRPDTKMSSTEDLQGAVSIEPTDEELQGAARPVSIEPTVAPLSANDELRKRLADSFQQYLNKPLEERSNPNCTGSFSCLAEDLTIPPEDQNDFVEIMISALGWFEEGNLQRGCYHLLRGFELISRRLDAKPVHSLNFWRWFAGISVVGEAMKTFGDRLPVEENDEVTQKLEAADALKSRNYYSALVDFQPFELPLNGNVPKALQFIRWVVQRVDEAKQSKEYIRAVFAVTGFIRELQKFGDFNFTHLPPKEDYLAQIRHDMKGIELDLMKWKEGVDI